MPKDLNPDTNFKIIDTRSPDTQARKADMPVKTGKDYFPELKPCPFCGGEAERMDMKSMRESCISCPSCGASTSLSHEDSAGFVMAWNRRTPESVSRTNLLVAALRSLVYLKSIKDAHGKTDEYLRRQPLAWELARKALDDNCDMSDVSVVTWVRYDGTPETLPDGNSRILHFWLKAPDWVIVWDVADGLAEVIQAGDLWAYFPDPPKGK